MALRRAWILPFLVFVGAGCGSRGSPGPGAPVAGPRDVIKTLTADVVVRGVDPAVERVRRVVAREEGFVQSATVTHEGDGAAHVEVRVPAERLDAFRHEVAGLGEVTSETEESTDVTDQRADLVARLHNARAEEARLLELLSGHTGNLADVLAVERELSSVREHIEQMESAEATLAARVDYAQATLELRGREVPFWQHPVAAVASAASNGLQAAASLAVGTAVVAATVAPSLAGVALVATALVALGRFLGRRRRVVAA